MHCHRNSAGLTAGLLPAVQDNPLIEAIDTSPAIGDGFGAEVIDHAVANGAVQGLEAAVGQQPRFNWDEVAVAGVTGGVGAEVSQDLPQGIPSLLRGGVGNALGGVAGTAAQSLITGQDFGSSLRDVLPSVIGQTVGNIVASNFESQSNNGWGGSSGQGSVNLQPMTSVLDGQPVIQAAGPLYGPGDLETTINLPTITPSVGDYAGANGAPGGPQMGDWVNMNDIQWRHTDNGWVGTVGTINAHSDADANVVGDGGTGNLYFRTMYDSGDAPPNVSGQWRANGATGGFEYQFTNGDQSASWDMSGPLGFGALNVAVSTTPQGLDSTAFGWNPEGQGLPSDTPSPADFIGPGEIKFASGLALTGLYKLGGGALLKAGAAKFAAMGFTRAAESATGAFNPAAKIGGDGLGIFADRTVTVTPKGLDLVSSHLSQFGDFAPNDMMLQRLQAAADAGVPVTGADAVFYTHEAAEATMMSRGMTYDAAHGAALEKYGVSPYSVYHPDVIQAAPEYFNNNWRSFWKIGQ